MYRYDYFFGSDFKVEFPTGSGNMMTLWDVADQLSGRLAAIFLKDANGRRPVYGNVEKFQTDPHWRDLISFYEYFHGDNGLGLGANHLTGWTGLIAKLMQQANDPWLKYSKREGLTMEEYFAGPKGQDLSPKGQEKK